MPAKYLPLKKITTITDENSHQHTTCPFCDKNLRKDNYPAHLKTELKNLDVTDADSMEKHLLEKNADSKWSSMGTLNMLVETSKTVSGKFQYHRGVCFDCHRIVPNKSTTLSSTETFEEHTCGYRKNKKKLEMEAQKNPSVIEPVKTAVVLSDESRLLRDTIKAIEKFRMSYKSLTDDQQSELTYEYNKVKNETEKQHEILLGIFRETLRYLVPKINQKSQRGVQEILLTEIEAEYSDMFFDCDGPDEIKATLFEKLNLVQTFDTEAQRDAIRAEVSKSMVDDHHEEVEELRAQINQYKKQNYSIMSELQSLRNLMK